LQNRPYPAPGSIPSDLRFTRTGTDPIQMSQNFRALESRLRILLGRFNEQLRRHCEHQVLAIRLDGQFTVWQRDTLSRHLGQHVGGITNLLFNCPVPPPLPFANALWLHACTGFEAHHAAPLCPVTNIPLNDTPIWYQQALHALEEELFHMVSTALTDHDLQVTLMTVRGSTHAGFPGISAAGSSAVAMVRDLCDPPNPAEGLVLILNDLNFQGTGNPSLDVATQAELRARIASFYTDPITGQVDSVRRQSDQDVARMIVVQGRIPTQRFMTASSKRLLSTIRLCDRQQPSVASSQLAYPAQLLPRALSRRPCTCSPRLSSSSIQSLPTHSSAVSPAPTVVSSIHMPCYSAPSHV
jgi:hypothetical protein